MIGIQSFTKTVNFSRLIQSDRPFPPIESPPDFSFTYLFYNRSTNRERKVYRSKERRIRNRSSYSNSVQGAKGSRLTRTADFSLTNQSKLNRWIEVEKKLHLSSYLHSNSSHSRKLRYKFSTKRNRDSIDRMIFPFVRMNVEKTVPVSSLLGSKFADPCANRENMIGVRVTLKQMKFRAI